MVLFGFYGHFLMILLKIEKFIVHCIPSEFEKPIQNE